MVGLQKARVSLAAAFVLGFLLSGIPPTGAAGNPLEKTPDQASERGIRPAPPPGNPTAPAHRPPTDEELDRLLESGFASEVKVDRVLVPAVVLDRKGRPVHGLRAEDFRLQEDLVPQKIDFFNVNQDERISIAFLLDISGSMRLLDKMGEAREAIAYFIDTLKPNDQAQLMTFADGEVDTVARFGTDPQVVRAFLYSLKAYGQTALHDAIAAAPGIVDAERTGRKAIVLITDGVDNFSKLSLREAVASARRTDVPVYAIGFSSEPEALKVDAPKTSTNAEILKTIAEETGGGFYLIHDPDDMKEAIRSIEEDIRSQYVLGYTPPQTACDGSFRSIQLKVDRDRYRVRTRKGYFSGPC